MVMGFIQPILIASAALAVLQHSKGSRSDEDWLNESHYHVENNVE